MVFSLNLLLCVSRPVFCIHSLYSLNPYSWLVFVAALLLCGLVCVFNVLILAFSVLVCLSSIRLFLLCINTIFIYFTSISNYLLGFEEIICFSRMCIRPSVSKASILAILSTISFAFNTNMSFEPQSKLPKGRYVSN